LSAVKTQPTTAEITRLRAEVKVLRAVLQEAVEWDESLERDTSEEDLVTPEWRLEAVALLKVDGRG
jgi:hypothetical protein